jgi:DNA repair exonuclease SbcCD ATPase subunit
MITESQELTPFLEQQKRVMAQKEQLDRDLEQRQKYTLTPGANEKHDPKAKYEIVTFDATNDRTTHRVITPLPTPQRIQSKPITKAELTEMIESLRSEMSEQQSRFDNKDSIDKERTDKRQELSSKVAELTQQLNAAQAELDQLNRAGSVRDEFIAFAKQVEGRITAISTGAYNFLLEKISQDKHEASYKELTPLLSESVRFAVDRLGIRFFTQGNFASLHRTHTDQITNARIEATLEKVYSASEKIEGALSK